MAKRYSGGRLVAAAPKGSGGGTQGRDGGIRRRASGTKGISRKGAPGTAGSGGRQKAAVGTVVVLLMLAATVSPSHGATISCARALDLVANCNTYLWNVNIPQPGAACCRGAKALDLIFASTPEEKRAVCFCLRAASRSAGPKLVLSHVKSLPRICFQHS